MKSVAVFRWMNSAAKKGVAALVGSKKNRNWTLLSSQYEALLKGGEQVTSVLEEMAKFLEDMNIDEASEEVAVELAAHGVIGKRVDEMESGFMMALDYMINIADQDKDDERKSFLEVIKETVLSHISNKCPPPHMRGKCLYSSSTTACQLKLRHDDKLHIVVIFEGEPKDDPDIDSQYHVLLFETSKPVDHLTAKAFWIPP